MALNFEHREDGTHYMTDDWREVGTISYTPRGWLVVASPAFMHGTSAMWWKSLKAAEYHMLAIAAEHDAT